jgi:hypothetical protein
VVSSLDLAGDHFLIALIGGVVQSSELLRGPLEAAIMGFAPHAEFVVPELPPVAGSLRLAATAEGAPGVDADLLTRVLGEAMGDLAPEKPA